MLQMVGHPWLCGLTAHLCVSGTLDDVCYTCSCRAEGKWNAFLFFATHPHSQHCGHRAWEGEGRWAEQLEEVPDQRVGEAGDERAAEVGGKKFSVINSLSVCPQQAACTFRLPHSLKAANPPGHWHGWNDRCWKSIPHFLRVCEVVCSHSQILHKLSLCGNHRECPNCQGVSQLSLALSIVSTFESASQFSWSQTLLGTLRGPEMENSNGLKKPARTWRYLISLK